jgi:FKBP-type peptidyl-prolyl cis-trans isomerase 2
MAVEKGNKVKVEYTGTLEDGTVFDSSEAHGKPLEFEVGSGMVIPGFEKAITGMELNEEKEVKLKPEEAYGDPNPQMVQKVPRDKIPEPPEGQKLEPGIMIGVGMPNGHQIPAKITEVNDTEITLDLNHPLAGKVLNFKFKVIGIEA